MTANCSRCCGRHSTLAPPSSSAAGRPRAVTGPGVVGNAKNQRVCDRCYRGGTRLASEIVPAIGADALRNLGFLAPLTLAEAHRVERVVRAALGFPRRPLQPFCMCLRRNLI